MCPLSLGVVQFGGIPVLVRIKYWRSVAKHPRLEVNTGLIFIPTRVLIKPEPPPTHITIPTHILARTIPIVEIRSGYPDLVLQYQRRQMQGKVELRQSIFIGREFNDVKNHCRDFYNDSLLCSR